MAVYTQGVEQGGGAVTREGGNTTEATTTSLTEVDLLTIASLTPADTEHLLILALGRKTTGAGAGGGLGLKLNATLVVTSDAFRSFTASNRVEDGQYKAWVGAIATGYSLGAGKIEFNQTYSTYPNGSMFSTGNGRPASVTSVVITADTDSASITVGCDEAHVYSWATA